MKRVAAICCAALLLVLPTLALGQDQPSPASHPLKGREVASIQLVDHAQVTALDMKKRTVTLSFSDGSKQTFVVDKAVKRLGEVKVGDTVKVRYREAVSVKLIKTKIPPSVTVESSVKREETSAKPAAVSEVRVTTTATINRIYDDGNRVVLKLPDDSVADVKVRDPKNLAMIKKGEVKEGDQIEITYLRALALSVEKTTDK